MYCYQYDITFQEVPNEVALLFSISGCPLHCKGCHSRHLWKEKSGIELTNHYFEETLQKYSRFVTCVCFFGGDWEEENLINLLKISKKFKLKTCLYTGQDYISNKLSAQLNFLKTGPWVKELGGLDCKLTNQTFFNLDSGEKLNSFFIKK